MHMCTRLLSVLWRALQVRYQGVDWRDRGLWLCNEQRNPYEYILEDPIALAPMEVMFVKVKAGFVERRVPSALTAVAYDDAFNQTAEVRPPCASSTPRAAVDSCRGDRRQKLHACINSTGCGRMDRRPGMQLLSD